MAVIAYKSVEDIITFKVNRELNHFTGPESGVLLSLLLGGQKESPLVPVESKGAYEEMVKTPSSNSKEYFSTGTYINIQKPPRELIALPFIPYILW